ncbi:hypothetical protein Plhal304r1_c091g0171931 [Plasmopara halstedii]
MMVPDREFILVMSLPSGMSGSLIWELFEGSSGFILVALGAIVFYSITHNFNRDKVRACSRAWDCLGWPLTIVVSSTVRFTTFPALEKGTD